MGNLVFKNNSAMECRDGITVGRQTVYTLLIGLLTTFLVPGQFQAHIDLAYPDGPVILQAYQIVEIRWDVYIAHGPGTIKIEFSSDGGASYTTIVDGLVFTGPADQFGSYEWVVPRVDSTQCKIKVTYEVGNVIYFNGYSAGENDPIFTIQVPVMSSIDDFVALIEGSQVPTSSTGRGVGRFTIDTAANMLSYDIRFAGLSAAETVSHIHGPADFGVNSGTKHDLPLGNPKIGVWNYNEADEGDILGGRMYVNIHSSTFPSGEICGQIVNMVAGIDGPQDSTPSTTTGIGNFIINTDTNELRYHLAYGNLSSNETAVHIHGFGAHTRNAPPVHTLPMMSNLKEGVYNYDEADEESILNGLSYVNIHSENYPAGEIRGQVTNIVSLIDAEQTVDSVVSPAFGVGHFSLDLDEQDLGFYPIFPI